MLIYLMISWLNWSRNISTKSTEIPTQSVIVTIMNHTLYFWLRPRSHYPWLLRKYLFSLTQYWCKGMRPFTTYNCNQCQDWWNIWLFASLQCSAYTYCSWAFIQSLNMWRLPVPPAGVHEICWSSHLWWPIFSKNDSLVHLLLYIFLSLIFRWPCQCPPSFFLREQTMLKYVHSIIAHTCLTQWWRARFKHCRHIFQLGCICR